jgi:hypothetical protein
MVVNVVDFMHVGDALRVDLTAIVVAEKSYAEYCIR